ncbi:MAG: hypothetical protein JNL54_11425 [Kineosporiaceae bacterium]|nr:hypothetical protein [Kineosporiaceae bacterium]
MAEDTTFAEAGPPSSAAARSPRRPPQRPFGSPAARGDVNTSDGPDAETREVLTGVLPAEDRRPRRGVPLAARIPGAPTGPVEVRPVFDFGHRGPQLPTAQPDDRVRLVRDEGTSVLATLIRLTGDLSLAQDWVQDATVRAVETSPRDGIPHSRGPGWSPPPGGVQSTLCGASGSERSRRPRRWTTPQPSGTRRRLGLRPRGAARPGRRPRGAGRRRLASERVHLLPPGARSRHPGGAGAAHAVRADHRGGGAGAAAAEGDRREAAHPGTAEDRPAPDPVPGAGRARATSGVAACGYLFLNKGDAARSEDDPGRALTSWRSRSGSGCW